jgi:type IV secretion system protein VirD4
MEKMQIVREAAEGVSTTDLATRFGVTARAVRYVLKADAERQTDAAIPVSAVSVKVTTAELAALDAVLAAAGIESRAEGLRRLIQAAGGVFVPDAQMAAEMARYRASLHEVGNGVAQIAKQMTLATRRALQGNAGVKLYLTPSDEKTVEELSKAVGKTTKTVVTRSQSIGKNPFEGRSQSTRTEESSLLPEDEARRLPLDEIVMVIDAQMPVRAKRIQYFDDRLFKAIHAAQKGELPFPKPGSDGPQGNLPLSVRAMPMTPPPIGSRGAEADVERAGVAAGGRPSGQTHVAPKKTAPVVQAVVAEEQRQMVMDFGSPVVDAEDVVDQSQMRSAIDGLEEMEAILREGDGAKLVG